MNHIKEQAGFVGVLHIAKTKRFIFLLLATSLIFLGGNLYAKQCNNIRNDKKNPGQDKDCKGTQKKSGGGSVYFRTGDLTRTLQDLFIPGRGLSTDFTRTYHSRELIEADQFFLESGSWDMESGEYSGHGGRALTERNWTDFTMELDFKTLESEQQNPWEVVWIDLRYTDIQNHYYFLLNTQGRLEVTRVKNGQSTTLATKNTSLSPFDSHHLKVVANGTNIKFYVDSSTVPDLDVTDSTSTFIRTGSIGLDTVQFCHGHFDNLSITGTSELINGFTRMNWQTTPITGTWGLEQDNVYGGRFGRSLLLDQFKDFTFETSVRTPDPGPQNWDVAWINFRYTDVNNRYYIILQKDKTFELSRVKNGVTTTLNTQMTLSDPIEWNQFKIQTQGSNIKVWLNTAQILDMNDTDPLLEGQFALEAFGSRAFFDNTQITELNQTKFDRGWTWDTGWIMEDSSATLRRDDGFTARTTNDWRNFTMDFDTTMLETLGSWEFQIQLGYIGSNNYWYVSLHDQSGTPGAIDLRLKNGSDDILKQSATLPAGSTFGQNGATNHLQFVSISTGLKVFANGVLMFDYPLYHLDDGEIRIACGHDRKFSAMQIKGDPLYYNFYEDEQSDFVPVSGTWSFSEGTLDGSNGKAQTTTSWNDFDLKLDVRTTSAGSDDWNTATINFLYKDDANRYVVILQKSGYLEFTKYQLGVKTVLYVLSINKDPREWHNFHIVRTSGTRTQIYVDDGLKIDHTDNNPLITGFVSLEANNGSARFDNVSLKESAVYSNPFSQNVIGIFGRGWTMNYETRLTEKGNGDIVHLNTEGFRDHYTRNLDGTYTPQGGVYRKLSKFTTGFTLRENDGTSFNFSTGGVLQNITDRNNNKVTLGYDGNGRWTTITDPTGRVTTLSYGANGKVSQITDPASRTVQYGYNSALELISVTDARNNAESYTYDTLHHHMTQETDREGFVTKTQYYYNNQVSSVTDPSGSTTTFTYFFNDTHVTNGKGQTYLYAFDGIRVKSVKNPDGNTIIRGLDNNNNTTSRTDEQGAVTNYTYDANGNQTSVRDPLNNLTEFVYESTFNQMTKKTDPQGGVWTYQYDNRGNLTVATDPLGNGTTNTYDANGLLLSQKNPRGVITTYEYDTHGNLTKTTMDSGGLNIVTQYTYDIVGLRLTDTNPNNKTTTYEYDANGNVTKITDHLLNVTEYTYDKKNRVITTKDARNNITTDKYDWVGNTILTTDPLANSTTHVYDLVNFEHDAKSNRIKTIDPEGNVAQFVYDALDRLTVAIDSLGNGTTNTYDASGNRTSIKDANGNITNYSYDANNRLIEVRDALGGRTSYFYTISGCPSCSGPSIDQPTKIIDALGRPTTYQYDGNDRLIKIIDPLGNVTEFTYDGVGNKASRKDGKGVTTNYVYDNANRLTKIDYPGTSDDVDYTYDSAGNRLSMTDVFGVTNYTYDALNRLTQVSNPGSKTVSYTYDAVGNRTQLSATDAGNTDYTYDAVNRPTNLNAAGVGSTTFTYDKDGRRTKMTQSNNGTFTDYVYDSAGRILNQLNRKSDKSSISGHVYDYDKAGNRLAQFTFSPLSGQQNQTYIYDALNRLTQVKYSSETTVTFDNFSGIGQVQNWWDIDGTQVYQRSMDNSISFDSVHSMKVVYNKGSLPWSYFAAHPNQNGTDNNFSGKERFTFWVRVTVPPSDGSLTEMTVKFEDTSFATWETTVKTKTLSTFAWEQISIDLTQVTGINLASINNIMFFVAPGKSNVSGIFYIDEMKKVDLWTHDVSTYTYDAVGNRTQMVANSSTSTYSYNSSNQLLSVVSVSSASFTYDANGNQITQTEGSNTTTYNYDTENRIASIHVPSSNTHTYKYDGDGKRREKTIAGVTARFFYDLDEIILETDGTNNPKRRYVNGVSIDERLQSSQLPGNLNIEFYYTDALGSITGKSGITGNAEGFYTYDVFGSTRTGSSNTTSNRFYYTGREIDAETSLYHYRARTYNPTLGRFLQMDPLGLDGGSMTLYEYVSNSPVNFLDPYGLEVKCKKPSAWKQISKSSKVKSETKEDIWTQTGSESAGWGPACFCKWKLTNVRTTTVYEITKKSERSIECEDTCTKKKTTKKEYKTDTSSEIKQRTDPVLGSVTRKNSGYWSAFGGNSSTLGRSCICPYPR